MVFPLTVIKGKEEGVVFHPVDLQEWITNGWKIKEIKPSKD